MQTGEAAETKARLAGMDQCIADGLWSMVRKVGIPSEQLLCGGVARREGKDLGLPWGTDLNADLLWENAKQKD